MFHIGQKVVCVNDRPGQLNLLGLSNSKLVKGQIYTIRRIESDDSGWCGIWLEEIVERVLDIWSDRGPEEPAWSARRFRPIVERKTDISAFHEILRKSSRKDRIGA